MLVDSFSNISEYFETIPNLKNAVEFIEAQKEWQPGRYDFSGGYILYQDQETKASDEGTFENHRKYNDIQVLLEGSNWHALWNRVEKMKSSVPYDEAKDAERWEGETAAIIALEPGQFVSFFPTDAHKPDRFLPGDRAKRIRKYVIKLEIE